MRSIIEDRFRWWQTTDAKMGSKQEIWANAHGTRESL